MARLCGIVPHYQLVVWEYQLGLPRRGSGKSERLSEVHVSYTLEGGTAQARVYNPRSRQYHQVTLTWHRDIGVDITCSCDPQTYPCPHAVLVMAHIIQEEQRLPAEAWWDEYLAELISLSQRKRSPTYQWQLTQPYLLAFQLSWSPLPHFVYDPVLRVQPIYYAPPTTDPVEAPEQLLKEKSFLWKPATKPLPPDRCLNLSPAVVALANMLIAGMSRQGHIYLLDDFKRFSRLISVSLQALHTLAQHEPIPLVYLSGDGASHLLTFLPPEVTLRLGIGLEEDHEGLILAPVLLLNEETLPPEQWDLVQTGPPLVLLVQERWLALVDEADLLEAWRMWEQFPQHALRIPRRDVAYFQREVLPRLLSYVPIYSTLLHVTTLRLPPRPRLYLEEDEEHLLAAELRFAYGDHEVPYAPNASALVVPEDQPWHYTRIVRDVAQEAEYHRIATSKAYGLKRGTREAPARLLLRKRVHPLDFLLEKVPALLEAGFEVYGEEQLTRHRVTRHRPVLQVAVRSSGIDWFDLQVHVAFGDQTVPLAEVLRALRKQRRYVKLADGTMGAIPEEWIQRFRRLFAFADVEEERLRLSLYHASLVEALLEEEQAQVQVEKEAQARLQALREFRGMRDVPLPRGLRGELRPYQVAGYRWLHFLHDYRLGGILADDMGLGKTLQVLAFLLSLRESGHAQAADLIVVPRSLLGHWQREVERFTPDLKVLLYFGPQRPSPATFDRYDLVLTTYGIMRSDVEKLRQYTFHYIVLDESQAIKNPVAKTARAARRLRGEHRLALTGTPVENTALELWAQFAFVMPGLLGNLETFKTTFVLPIERHRDEEAAQTLRRMVYPFLLRRTKEQVAPELPPRSEHILYCEMEPAQRRLYERTRNAYRTLLLQLIEQEGLHRARFKILEGLLRLRQICDHPRLVDAQFRGGSGKMATLITILQTLQEEGHKVLIFSQFVKMLRLIREHLDQEGVPYAYLDGQTPNRQAVVDRFQQDPDIPFFLISLKAGGLGLNLTAADYVVHVDPWWNPAVERQAADRTHRIGQEKPVFIYKLITRDSVEEKVLQLQEQKKALVDRLITVEKDFFKELTAEDVAMLFS